LIFLREWEVAITSFIVETARLTCCKIEYKVEVCVSVLRDDWIHFQVCVQEVEICLREHWSIGQSRSPFSYLISHAGVIIYFVLGIAVTTGR